MKCNKTQNRLLKSNVLLLFLLFKKIDGVYLRQEVTGRKRFKPLVHGQPLAYRLYLLTAQWTRKDPVLDRLTHVCAQAVTTERVQTWQRAGFAHLLQAQGACKDVVCHLADAGHCQRSASSLATSLANVHPREGLWKSVIIFYIHLMGFWVCRRQLCFITEGFWKSVSSGVFHHRDFRKSVVRCIPSQISESLCRQLYFITGFWDLCRQVYFITGFWKSVSSCVFHHIVCEGLSLYII